MKIFITGASSGIGLATTNLFEQHGHQVTAPTRNTLDLDNLFAVANFNLTGYDVLINNAGHAKGSPHTLKDALIEHIISAYHVNLVSPVLLTKQFISQNTTGTIVNVTSSSCDRIGKDSIAYDNSKKALRAFTELCRVEETNQNFRFVEVTPGRTKTKMKYNNGNTDQHSINYTGPYAHSLSSEQVAEVIYAGVINPYLDTIKIKHPLDIKK